MRERPLGVWLVALALLLSPLAYAVEAWFAMPHPVTWDGVANVFPNVKLAAIALGPAVGALALAVRLAGWYALIGYAGFSVGVNAGFAKLAPLRAAPLALYAVSGLVLILIFSRKSLRLPYFEPQLRWWEQAPRYRIHGEVSFGKDVAPGRLYDISASGAYVVTEQACRVGQFVKLSFDVAGTRLAMTAEVVRVGDGTKNPRGIGVRFFGAPKNLAKVLEQLEEVGSATPQLR